MAYFTPHLLPELEFDTDSSRAEFYGGLEERLIAKALARRCSIGRISD
jgi:hypothetical protein